MTAADGRGCAAPAGLAQVPAPPIAIPTGIKFVNWIGTMWKGQLTFETPMVFAIGFAVTFLFGGMTGVLLASPRSTSTSPTPTSWWRTYKSTGSAPRPTLAGTPRPRNTRHRPQATRPSRTMTRGPDDDRHGW
jgi:Cytochrome C and Quinol oxidase polypeptide I